MVDLVEVLHQGLEAVYGDLGERIQATRATARLLREHGLRDEAKWLEGRIDDDWCIRQGVCPTCGSELEYKQVTEWAPYGATVAASRGSVPWCPECGEV